MKKSDVCVIYTITAFVLLLVVTIINMARAGDGPGKARIKLFQPENAAAAKKEEDEPVLDYLPKDSSDCRNETLTARMPIPSNTGKGISFLGATYECIVLWNKERQVERSARPAIYRKKSAFGFAVVLLLVLSCACFVRTAAEAQRRRDMEMVASILGSGGGVGCGAHCAGGVGGLAVASRVAGEEERYVVRLSPRQEGQRQQQPQQPELRVNLDPPAPLMRAPRAATAVAAEAIPTYEEAVRLTSPPPSYERAVGTVADKCFVVL